MVLVRRHLRRIKKLESIYGKVESVTLVGSRATGRARKDSDWDYVVVTRPWKRFKHLPHRLTPIEDDGDMLDITLDSKAPFRRRR